MIEEFDEVEERLKLLNDNLPLTLKKFADKKAQEFLNLVVNRTPVGIDTESPGALRSSWKCTSFVSTGEPYLLISNDRKYATFVEYGHIQHPGQYVPKLGKRLKATFVNGRYMATKSINDIMLNIDKDFDNEINLLMRRCGLE